MMKCGFRRNKENSESAVATLIEYIMVSGVCLALLVVMLLLVNTNIMENPANRVVYVAFTDIGNGVSTRMVDVYSLAPTNGTIMSQFDLPDEIVGRSYQIEIQGIQTGQDVWVYRGVLESRTSLSGIGANEKGAAGGNTTGAGINRISYNSEGESP
jgi:hypothetical protein